MPVPPDDAAAESSTDWGPRGSCPRCGSGEVVHLVMGMPTRELVETAPDWVWFGGCVVDGPEDRRCESCDHVWATDPSRRW